MRTLVFCTAHAMAASTWERRYWPWLDSMRRSGLATQSLIVDDGSPVLPGWPDLPIVTGPQLPIDPGPEAVLFRFPNRLGRLARENFPGWHRSQALAASWAERFGFERVIHVESDADFVSARMRDWAAGFTQGWVSPWCARYNMPEIAIQAVAGLALPTYFSFWRRPYAETLENRSHEMMLPLTGIAQAVKGERWGERAEDVPAEADYVCQIPATADETYAWWRRGEAGPTVGEPVWRVRFGDGGDFAGSGGEGWAGPEPAFQWMTGLESFLPLPALDLGRSYVLRLGVTPFTGGGEIARQRLALFLGERRVAEWEIEGATWVGCVLPPGSLAGAARLRFLHPDCARPSELGLSQDGRNLAVAASELLLAPVDPAIPERKVIS